MINVVWFKRDLRVADHEPLFQAAKQGPVLPLYVVESDYWKLPETSSRHYVFLTECLKDLASQGVPLCIRNGDVSAVLDSIHRDQGIAGLWSHEETGNAWTYKRDKQVANWCKSHAIKWKQIPQFGVQRGTVNRDQWARHWEKAMSEPYVPAPSNVHWVELPSDPLPTSEKLKLDEPPCPYRQKGGARHAIGLLESFFHSGRARDYQADMASPLTAADACSRLSPHLAMGTLSMRTVVQAAYKELSNIGNIPPIQRPLSKRSAQSFIARLHWHCHFIQKLESEPEIEWRDLHPAFRGARTNGVGHPHYEAWATGQTGFPFIDACMRSLIATGWINFRMRAMLIAFASYHLWLDWRATGTRLAQLFTDYEPGIHWPQVQMQSGSTAINTPRIYNPVKQSFDQDPDGEFIRQWLPELRRLTGRALHEPWTLSPVEAKSIGFVLDETYPDRIVDHEAAARSAREKLTKIRATSGFGTHQRAIYLKHGSRKSSRHTPAQQRPWKKPTSEAQLELDI